MCDYWRLMTRFGQMTTMRIVPEDLFLYYYCRTVAVDNTHAQLTSTTDPGTRVVGIMDMSSVRYSYFEPAHYFLQKKGSETLRL